MKTFDEAFTACSRATKSEDDARSASDEMINIHERYGEFAKQVLGSEQVRHAMEVWAEIAFDHGVSSAVFTAFMSGLITGMEMEKAE
jgi:succinyl-CoA synthetase beta subunit